MLKAVKRIRAGQCVQLPAGTTHVMVTSGGHLKAKVGSVRNPVTDRAHRYRANAHPPAGPRQCAFCGAKRDVQVGHLDGHEENGEPRNLIWTCRSCNAVLSHAFKRRGLGRRTHQYNPDAGASSVGQWLIAVSSMKGESDAMTVPAAVAMIRATPASRRSEFAKRIWSLRRQRGTDRTAVPF